MAILSAGGVLRSKKLQKGSTLSILANIPDISRSITDYEDVHAFSFFLKKQKKTNFLLNFKSKRSNPFIVCEEPPAPAQVEKAAIGGLKLPIFKLDLEPFSKVTTYDDI